MHDVGPYGVETCRGQRNGYQTPLNLLIYKGPFGNEERVTDFITDFTDSFALQKITNSSYTFPGVTRTIHSTKVRYGKVAL